MFYYVDQKQRNVALNDLKIKNASEDLFLVGYLFL